MKKTIIKSTISLIILSILAKVLSFFVRILLARSLPLEAMNLYSLACPTMIFIITVAQMGIPCALSKLIAQSNQHSCYLKASIFLSIFTNIITTFLFIITIPILSLKILNQPNIKDILFAIIPLIPAVTISGLLKGYLFGIQEHIPATTCQIFEEAGRIIFLIIFLKLPNLSIIQMAQISMLSITIGEIVSSSYMVLNIIAKRQTFFTNKTIAFTKKQHLREIISVALPMTGSRFIGSITYFLEPIVMIIGINSIQASSIIQTYGKLNGYVLPIITVPSFLTVALSNFLLPSFTFHYSRNHYKLASKLFITIMICCFFIGIGCSFVCYFFSEELLQLFYHSTNGSTLLKALAWPFALYALQPPLSSILHALSKSKATVIDTLLGSIMRLLCVFFMTKIIGDSALVLALIIGMLTTTICHCIRVTICFTKKQKL